MLIRYSVLNASGGEIFAYNTRYWSLNDYNPQLVSGLIQAILSLSEIYLSPIKKIQFFNELIYIRSFHEFSLLIISSQVLDESEIEEYFNNLAKETILMINERQGEIFSDDEDYIDRIKLILLPLIDELPRGSIKILKEPKTISKIAVLGLAKAGKTSIINKLFEKWNLDQINNIKPTLNISTKVKFQEFLNTTLTIHDFGGQKLYRDAYLKSDKFWTEIKSIIFIIDIQNQKLFDESLIYLKEIWKMIEKNNSKNPRLNILLHKYDTDKRSQLGENVQACLTVFKDFINKSSFYFTTIEDSSSDIAIIKSLYFSLPEIMLQVILGELLIDNFDKYILPEILELKDDFKDEEFFNKSKDKLKKWAFSEGLNLAGKLEELWMSAIIGEFIPPERKLTSKRLDLNMNRESIKISIRDWSDEGIQKELTNFLLSEIIAGIFSSVHLASPEIIDNDRNSTTWEIKL